MKTRQLKADLARIKSVVEGDRRCVSGDLENMLKYDLNCVLGGYFESGGVTDIHMTPVKGGLAVNITIIAKSIKSAGVRPSDTSVMI